MALVERLLADYYAMVYRFILVPFHFLILDAATDAQASLLTLVGQEAIAHAAAIFATLTAAFTFATVQKEPLTRNRTTFCVLILSVLLAGSIYAGLRLYYYGVLSGIVLNHSGVPNQTLTQYWGNVTYLMSHSSGPNSTYLLTNLGLGLTIQSISISYVVGFLMAVGVTSYSVENQGWWDTFHLLPLWFRAVFYLAAFDYMLEISAVRLLVRLGRPDFAAVLLALLSAGLGSFLLTKALNRKKMKTYAP